VDFEIVVKGLEKAIKSTNELEQIKERDLLHWTETIDSTAKQLCLDTDSSIGIKHMVGSKFHITLKNQQSIDCLINAIQIHLMSMPLLLRGMYSKLATNLNKGRTKI
jgi:hypothetical protein